MNYRELFVQCVLAEIITSSNAKCGASTLAYAYHISNCQGFFTKHMEYCESAYGDTHEEHMISSLGDMADEYVGWQFQTPNNLIEKPYFITTLEKKE